MSRNTPITAILRTACGCEKKMIIPSELPLIKVTIRSNRALSMPDPSAASFYVRTFERDRVIATGEGAMERIVEYTEVLPREYTQDWRNASVPRIDVHQLTPEGDWRVLNVNRVLRDINRIVVEVI